MFAEVLFTVHSFRDPPSLRVITVRADNTLLPAGETKSTGEVRQRPGLR